MSYKISANVHHGENLKMTLRSFLVLVVFCSTFLAGSSLAASVADKTPNEVFGKVMDLSLKVRALRQAKDIKIPWPDVPQQFDKAPRHVLQKALEVLTKINRYRLIHKLGKISISHFPGRDITPNEVFAIVERLNAEMDLILEPLLQDPVKRDTNAEGSKTPSDVYQALWAASRALDPVLGVRGFNPSDVYAQSLHVVNLVRYLRNSQNLPLNIPKPKRPHSKYPNHALASVYRLQEKISLAEKELWMVPIDVPPVPRRVITPTEVFDATETVLAELQRIKFRLGLDENFKTPQPVPGKTPDDVIVNIDWATKMLPIFPVTTPLVQFDPVGFTKTPNHVFAVTDHILGELIRYHDVMKVKTAPSTPPHVNGLKPKHVLQKTLESLEKVNHIRRKVGIGLGAVPHYPLRAITPQEVYDAALRLDEDLGILYEKASMPHISYYNIVDEKGFTGKSPSDVYRNMWQISLFLDTILGIKGFTPNDVYKEAQTVTAQLKIIAKRIGSLSSVVSPTPIQDVESSLVFNRSLKILKKVHKAQERSGLFSTSLPSVSIQKNVTPSDVFNLVRLIQAELSDLKIHLGIIKIAKRLKKPTGKKPRDAYQELGQAMGILDGMLGQKMGVP